MINGLIGNIQGAESSLTDTEPASRAVRAWRERPAGRSGSGQQGVSGVGRLSAGGRHAPALLVDEPLRHRQRQQPAEHEKPGEHVHARIVGARCSLEPAHHAYGLRKPARLPIELIIAMPAAAAVPPRNAVGRLQNSGSVVRMPIVASGEAEHRERGLVRPDHRQHEFPERADRGGDRDDASGARGAGPRCVRSGSSRPAAHTESPTAGRS